MKSSGPPLYFGEWIKQRRKLLDLTQDELARKTGCSASALRKIESGERRPSKQLAELLADSLKVPSEEKRDFIRVARGEVILERLHGPFQGIQSSPIIPPAPLLERNPAALTSKIPIKSAPLIGRDGELAAMEKILKNEQCRILTLTGVGGIGKTRLAIEFARRKCSTSQDLVFYIPLTPINNPEKIISAVADVLEFRYSGPVDPKEQLINFISRTIIGNALLIFDNLEHLLASSANQNEKTGLVFLINEILEAVPNIKILGTSRERLNLYGEWTYELHGLSVPPTNYVGPVEEYDSVTLFLSRAQRIKVGFQLTPDDEASLAYICRLVEGVPLAIELAAAWIGFLSCREIAQEIKSNIDFLTTSTRDIPERHRSIRATFEHSWNLLTDKERQVLCQLSVCPGGFDRVASQYIAGASLEILASLSAKSLIHRSNAGRYDLHGVIRQCTLSHLQAHPNKLETYERHCKYYLEFIHELEKSIKSAGQQDAIHKLSEEIDNIRAAWEWAIQHQKFSLLGKSGRTYGWYFEITGLYQEGIEQLELLYDQLKAEPDDGKWNRLIGLVWTHQALMYLRKGEFSNARKLFEESIAILRPTGDGSLLAEATIFLGIIMHLNGEFGQARLLVNEGLGFARAANDQWVEALAIFNSGYLASIMGSPNDGYEEMLTGLTIWRKIGDPHAISMGLNYLVPTLIKLGCYSEAKANMLESIELCKASQNRWGMGTAYRFLGLSMLAEGHIEEARTNFLKSLDIFGEYIVGWDIARTLSYLGDAIAAGREFEEARKIYLNALRISIDTQATIIALDILLGLAKILIETDQIMSAISLSAFVLEHSTTPLEAKERAQILFDEARKRVPDAQNTSDIHWQDEQSFERILEVMLMNE
jgi:predicted ATPase/transcriptional regulator with XRE-family HTH domain